MCLGRGVSGQESYLAGFSGQLVALVADTEQERERPATCQVQQGEVSCEETRRWDKRGVTLAEVQSNSMRVE